jgi:hypothetical protein
MNQDDFAAFNRAQAGRARRFATQVMHSHPDIAQSLETIAREFDERATGGSTEKTAAGDSFPPGTNYRVVPLKDGNHGVEVTPPGQPPSTVETFMSEGEAEAWIVAQEQKTAEAHPIVQQRRG